jgi:transketolase
MTAIANGMAYHQGVRPYVSTFFVFSDYMRPSIRLAALTHLPAIYVWTHDSVGVGEDGPTHQPVEHLMALRAIPNLLVLRPGDANETAAAWATVLQHHEGPAGLVLSRQNLPVLEGTDREGVARGAYVLAEATGDWPQLILIATGSELSLAMQAREQLEAEGIATRVVSMPCWELFDQQDAAYRDAVLPPLVRSRVSVEAGITCGWERWIGPAGRAVGIDRFGASAPGSEVMRHLGIDAQHVVAAAHETLEGGSRS